MKKRKGNRCAQPVRSQVETVTGAAKDISVARGRPLPFGCAAEPDGHNFAIFSRHADRLTLLLFDAGAPNAPCFSHELDPSCQRTGDVWHVRLDGVPPGSTYAWCADGPYDPSRGHRFDVGERLLDPYATALTGNEPSRSVRDGETPLPGGVR